MDKKIAVLGTGANGSCTAADLTNAATLRGWSMTVTLVDMVWGAILTGAATAVGVWLGLKFA